LAGVGRCFLHFETKEKAKSFTEEKSTERLSGGGRLAIDIAITTD
jgi:hypothetical protein